MSLFRIGRFTLSSGKKAGWKIDCDALDKGDWEALAVIASQVIDLDRFSAFIPVPTGGNPFAEALLGQCRDMPGARAGLSAATLGRRSPPKDDRPRLIVDDVLTTGKSIIEAMDQPYDRGLVVFARGPLPIGVEALFRLKS